MDLKPSVELQRRRYQYFAYLVIRDAIGFYLGIPKFLEDDDLNSVFETLYNQKIKALEKKKRRELTTDERFKCRLSVDKFIVKRRSELIEDFEHAKDVLFNDNMWLQWLDLNPEYLQKYLDSLPEESRERLAVIPGWTTRDHTLGRPYVNDSFQMSTI